MIYNYLCMMMYILILWLIGQAVLKCSALSEMPYKNMHFISVPLGIPLCALIADLLYLRLGTSVGTVRIVYGILAFCSFLVILKKGISKQDVIGLLGVYVIFNIMLLPAIWNGAKYYVHRGNIWDHYFYLSEVVYMSIYRMSDMTTGLLSTVNVADVYSFGYGAICSDRPTAPLLCAVFAGKGWGNLFFYAHLFLVMVWTGAFGSMMLALELIAGKFKNRTYHVSRNILMVLLGLLYIWGFFGQIQYDINAWSQLAVLGGLIAFVSIYFIILGEIIKGNRGLTFGRYLVLLGAGSGLFLIYPENTMLQGAFLVLGSVILLVAKKREIAMKTILSFLALPILIVAVVAFLHSGTVRFALVQINSSGSEIRQGWASYFDAYWQGYHPLSADASVKGWIKKAICFLPSLFGMYVVTPDWTVNVTIKLIWMGVVAALGIGLAAYLIKYLFQIKSLLQDEEKWQRGMIGLMCYIGLAVYTVMMLCGKYWSAGKLFLYISPYVYLLLTYPIWDLWDRCVNDVGMVKKTGRIVILTVSCIFVCCQGGAVCMRVYDAVANKDCTGYLGNYPSDQAPYLKQNYPYEFDASAYEDNEVVAICIEDSWYQDYVKLSLAYEGIFYYAVPDTVFNRVIYKEVQQEINEGDIVINIESTYKTGGNGNR